MQIAEDCYGIAGPQLKFCIRDYGNKNIARGNKTHCSLQSPGDTLELSVKEEERKSHFLIAGRIENELYKKLLRTF